LLVIILIDDQPHLTVLGHNSAAAAPGGKQVAHNGLLQMAFHGFAQRTCAEQRMESFTHEKFQRLAADFQNKPCRPEPGGFSGDLQGTDLPLHVRAKTGEHEFFVNPPTNFGHTS
jgi:hypothetical protein